MVTRCMVGICMKGGRILSRWMMIGRRMLSRFMLGRRIFSRWMEGRRMISRWLVGRRVLSHWRLGRTIFSHWMRSNVPGFALEQMAFWGELIVTANYFALKCRMLVVRRRFAEHIGLILPLSRRRIFWEVANYGCK